MKKHIVNEHLVALIQNKKHKKALDDIIVGQQKGKKSKIMDPSTIIESFFSQNPYITNDPSQFLFIKGLILFIGKGHMSMSIVEVHGCGLL
jgi:hypothetical protein